MPRVPWSSSTATSSRSTCSIRDTSILGNALDRGIAQLSAGGFAVDYLELRDATDLTPMARLAGPARLLAAARIGRTRLIDNVPVLLA